MLGANINFRKPIRLNYMEMLRKNLLIVCVYELSVPISTTETLKKTYQRKISIKI